MENQWRPEEWKEFRKNLEDLSLEEIRQLADEVGIAFSGGNDSITDSRNFSAKEQFILVMDEVDKAKLVREYEALLKRRTS
ncbi:MAG TPA: hypothetical protein VFE87_01420 [Candidatus Paceibacterota bacterium]|nr:hypothetical protein [Candidatus Paceibacterota bacterium]